MVLLCRVSTFVLHIVVNKAHQLAAKWMWLDGFHCLSSLVHTILLLSRHLADLGEMWFFNISNYSTIATEVYKSSTRIVRCALSSFAYYLITAFFSTLQTIHT